MIAIGNNAAPIKIYIENRPPMPPYETLEHCLPLRKYDIDTICKKTGNHWRKIFNVYAKLVFELSPQSFDTWQQLRDELLLQKESEQCLVFSEPIFTRPAKELAIIMGKGYATKLNIAQQCEWLTPFFAVNPKRKIIICPYFDYRQLSNIKITQLAALITQLK